MANHSWRSLSTSRGVLVNGAYAEAQLLSFESKSGWFGGGINSNRNLDGIFVMALSAAGCRIVFLINQNAIISELLNYG